MRLARWMIVSLVALLLVAWGLYGLSRSVVHEAWDHVYKTVADLPDNDVGLVLGTSNFTKAGTPNPLFKYRIQAAALLWKAGKVKHLLLSGANPEPSYNEPQRMFQALIEHGVPAEVMTLDYAGIRTLDSVVRAREIFGLRRYTIISQRFHDFRAVYIARAYGIEAIAFAAPEADRHFPLRTRTREFFARLMALMDVHILETQPRFLGDPQPITIGRSATPVLTANPQLDAPEGN